MGIIKGWQSLVASELIRNDFRVEQIKHDHFELLSCNTQLILNLVPLINGYRPQDLVEIQTQYHKSGIYLVHLWEDIWEMRKDQVLGRIKSILGLNQRLHGRKGLVIKITQKQADDFLLVNHIQGSATSKHKFGLLIGDELVAVACFSGLRPMKHIGPDYKSIELIRFASLIGFTVTGGFSKLLKHLIRLLDPNDIMSYADRDWSLGQAYDLGGFKLVDVIPPTQIWLQKEGMLRFFPHRLPPGLGECIPVFNTGNLKYIYYLK